MVWENGYVFSRGEEQARHNAKKRQGQSRNSDFKLIRYSLEEFKKYILKEMDTTDVKL